MCGDSLHVTELRLHYENMRGKVQMIYIDPPYGIRYDSNFQQRVDTTANEGKGCSRRCMTIKAFRDIPGLWGRTHTFPTYKSGYICAASCFPKREAFSFRSAKITYTLFEHC